MIKEVLLCTMLIYYNLIGITKETDQQYGCFDRFQSKFNEIVKQLL